MMPFAIGRCLQYSSIIYVMLLAMILLLTPYSRLKQKNRIIPLFFLIGILTAYLDLLSFPTVTLTMPLCLPYLLDGETHETLFKKLRFLFFCCLAWGVGYAGMWVGKWVIAFIVEGPALFGNLFGSISIRLSNDALWIGRVSRISILVKNLGTCFINPMLTLPFVFSVLWLLALCIRRKMRFLQLAESSVPFIFIFLIPVLWILVMCNHSAIHRFFTYRNLAPSVFTVLSCLIYALKKQSTALR